MKTNHRRKNPVARVINEFNRPRTHRAGTDYSRKKKYGLTKELLKDFG